MAKTKQQIETQVEIAVKEFHKRYTKTDTCWLWNLSISAGGYGVFRIPGTKKCSTAHRVSYLIHKGPIPEGLLICHKCDVRHCVNPDHLFAGSAKRNMQDMVNKGRNKGGFSYDPTTKQQLKELIESRKKSRPVAPPLSFYLAIPF